MWNTLSKGLLFGLAVAINLVACNAGPATDPTVQKAVIKTVSSLEEPDIDGFCQVTARVLAGDSASVYWRAYSEDPEGNIWTVECLTERTRVTSTGKETIEEELGSFLYNIAEETLYMDNHWARIFYNLGIDVDLNTTPFSLPVPYAGSQD